jgi:membrane protease YdiL (CAAX protease family)
MGPGPVMFFINKYTISLLPMLSCIAILYLLRKEVKVIDFNTTIRDVSMYKWVFNGLKYCLFAHAICTLLFGNSVMPINELIQNYLIMPFYVVIIAPIVEEIVYRKIIFGGLDKRFNFWIGAIISSAIFAIGHLSPERLLAYFITGIVLCYVYKKSNTLLTSMLIHALLNYIALFVSTIKS